MRAFSAAGRSSHIQELERRFAFASLKDGTVSRHIPGSLEQLNVNESYHNGSTNSVASTPSSSSNSDDSDVESTAEAEILMSEDFSKRPSYSDAAQALRQVKKGKAYGCIPALYFRSWLQSFLFWWGCFVHRNSYLVLFFGLVILGLFCVGLKGVKIETEIESLWVEKGGRLDSERSFINNIAEQHGMDSTAASFQVVIQTPLRGRGTDILSKSDLLAHVDLMLNVTRMEIEMFGTTWRLEDMCFKPDPPRLSAELDMLNEILEKIMPCVIITPLDCFWEGSKPLGPVSPILVPDYVSAFIGLPAQLTWQNLDPGFILAEAKSWYPDALEGVSGLFERAGITTAFQTKPCLNPFDPMCPKLAPNFQRNATLDIGDILTGGCKGYASKLMDWPENLIIGGIEKHDDVITRAEALQSIMLVLQPGAFYKRFITHQKANLTQELWTKDNANKVLLAWQRNFSELIYNSGFNQDLAIREAYFKSHAISVPLPVAQSPTVAPVKTPVTPKLFSTPPRLFFEHHNDNTSNNGNGSSQQLLRRRFVRAADTSELFQGAEQSEATSLLKRRSSVPPMFHPLAGTSVNDMLKEFSKFKPDIIVYGYCLMVIYAAVSLISCKARGVRSAVGLAMVGCLLVTVATLAGLGCSTILGIQFNAATTQIVPFLTLGLGVDDMFLLVYNYQEINRLTNKHELGYLLKETGLSVMLTSINNILAFVFGSFLPVPALRSFCLQTAILLVFNFLSIVSIYPAMMAVDLIRRRSKRVDCLCCIKVNKDRIRPTVLSNASEISVESRNRDKSTAKLIESSLSYQPMVNDSSAPASPIMPLRNGTVGILAPNGITVQPRVKRLSSRQSHHSHRSTASGGRRSTRGRMTCHKLTLHHFVKHVYGPFLTSLPIKVFVILAFMVMLGIGVIGVTRLQLGLEMTDIVPRGTAPYDFLSAREDYFSFYSMTAVIRGKFNYSTEQKLLYDYRRSLNKISYVVRHHENEDGVFWVSLMRDWLTDLQEKFNRDLQAKAFNIKADGKEKILCEDWDKNQFKASDDGLLAYKLIVNAGDKVDHSRVGKTQLVRDGIINPAGFYNYLTAWHYMDLMGTYVSQANLVPTPHPTWQYRKGLCNNTKQNDDYLIIPPAKPIVFSQMPFFLDQLTDTPHVVDMISKVRQVSESYERQGLPNFPEGIPFTFWDLYVNLRQNLLICLSLITAAVFVVITVLLMSPWTACIIVSVLVMLVVELAGFMGVIGLKLNPVSAVTLVTAVGIGVEFTVHICFSYLTALGDRNQRMIATFDHMFIPVLHGGLSTLLGVIMLAFSEFEFIVRYFFIVMSALIVLGLFNGLLFLPVLLSIIGPRSEVRPKDGTYYLAPPTPSLPKPPKGLPGSKDASGGKNNADPGANNSDSQHPSDPTDPRSQRMLSLDPRQQYHLLHPPGGGRPVMVIRGGMPHRRFSSEETEVSPSRASLSTIAEESTIERMSPSSTIAATPPIAAGGFVVSRGVSPANAFDAQCTIHSIPPSRADSVASSRYSDSTDSIATGRTVVTPPRLRRSSPTADDGSAMECYSDGKYRRLSGDNLNGGVSGSLKQVGNSARRRWSSTGLASKLRKDVQPSPPPQAPAENPFPSNDGGDRSPGTPPDPESSSPCELDLGAAGAIDRLGSAPVVYLSPRSVSVSDAALASPRGVSAGSSPAVRHNSLLQHRQAAQNQQRLHTHLEPDPPKQRPGMGAMRGGEFGHRLTMDFNTAPVIVVCGNKPPPPLPPKKSASGSTGSGLNGPSVTTF